MPLHVEFANISSHPVSDLWFFSLMSAFTKKLTRFPFLLIFTSICYPCLSDIIQPSRNKMISHCGHYLLFLTFFLFWWSAIYLHIFSFVLFVLYINIYISVLYMLLYIICLEISHCFDIYIYIYHSKVMKMYSLCFLILVFFSPRYIEISYIYNIQLINLSCTMQWFSTCI